ncbi:unnamed protein product [Symbiodinium sp. CCMP2592]|nr:unnamed protein product [Symbiodinium sp. CCMP2592]
MSQQQPDHAPKVNAFRSYCMQVVEQLCGEFEREVLQMTQDIVRYRGELARCADLLAFQLGKEKQYHSMLENIAGNTSNLCGKAAEVGQKHSANDGVKIQMHQLLEQMFEGGKGAIAEGFGNLDEHRQMAETHLQTSAELQNQSVAIQKELDNILQALQVPPVSYSNAPIIMGPSMMQPQATRALPGQGFGAKPAIPGMVSGTGGFSPGPRSVPGSPVFTPSSGFVGAGGLPQTPQAPVGLKGGRMGQMA